MKQYIGDGVYVEFDGYFLILTTSDGVSVTNTIVLEPKVWRGLERFVNELGKDKAGK